MFSATKTCLACHKEQIGDRVNHSVRGGQGAPGPSDLPLSRGLCFLSTFRLKCDSPGFLFLENTCDEFHAGKEKLLTGKASDREGAS